MIDYEFHCREVYERGFTAIPSLFSPDDCAKMRALLMGYWESKGRPPMTGFGIPIHPLVEQIPEIATLYIKPEVVEILRRIFRDEVRLVHTGSRLSNETSGAAISWHHHYGWDEDDAHTRARISRLLGGVYVDGTQRDTGPLVVLPRQWNEPIGPPRGELTQAWPGEFEVMVPPGSFTIFDTALWHTARRGDRPGFRFLFGSHFQARGDHRPHPEDNTTPDITSLAQVRDTPVMRQLLAP